MLLGLTACGGGGGGSGGGGAGNVVHSIEGSVVDGPIVDATVHVYASDGTLLHTTTSDSSARYSANFQVDESQYPLTIEVVGGIDLVTRRAPDFDLLSVVTGPESNGVININPFTTVATEMARRMKGGLNKANIEAANEVVVEQLNFGLDKDLVPDPFHTDVDQDNAAVLVKASEALGEMLRRAHNNLSENGLSSDMGDTMHLLAGDLVDGVLNGSSSADSRVADTFTQVSSQILREAMRNELKVDGVNATSALDDSILQLQPDTPFSKLTDSVAVNREMLLQAKTVGVIVEESGSGNAPLTVSGSSQATQAVADIAAVDPARVYPVTTDPATVDATRVFPVTAEPTNADPVVGGSGGNTPDGSVAVAPPGKGPDTVQVVIGADPVQEPVSALNSAPRLSGSPKRNLQVGETYSFKPGVVDSDGDTLTFTIRNRPTWSSFNNATGRLSGSPKSGDVGVTGGIIITVSDGVSTDTIGPFTIRVNEASAVSTVVQRKKYNPGHYLALYGFEKQSAMYDGAHPGIRGIQKRYTWGSLETALGQYDFSQIESDLAVAASQGLQLIVMVEDKSFKNDPQPTPKYLWGDQYTVPTRIGGYIAVRHNPYVVERMKALTRALAERFDSHPNFEGIAYQETAIGFTTAVVKATGYTPEKYRDALIDVLLNAAESFPTSQVFWYMNFLKGHQSYIAKVAEAVAPAGVIMGGPDILPDDHAIKTHAYPFYEQFNGKMKLFCSAQNHSYYHKHQDTSYPTEFWTPKELFIFARDQLHVNYVFWNHNTWLSGPAGSYRWKDALPVIEANPVFNP